MSGLRHDARPVELAGRAADQARDRRPHRRGRHEEPRSRSGSSRSTARRSSRRRGARASGSLAWWVADGGIAGGGGCGRRSARGAGRAARRAGARRAAARSRARAAARRRARGASRLIERIPRSCSSRVSLRSLTPCVLPLVPGYLSAVSAVEANRLGEPRRRAAGRARDAAVHPRVHRRLRAARARRPPRSAESSTRTSAGDRRSRPGRARACVHGVCCRGPSGSLRPGS